MRVPEVIAPEAAMLLAPEIAPPVIETELASCVAIVPSPRLLRALDALEMPYVMVTAPVDALADKLNPVAELVAARDDTPDAAEVAHTGAPPLTVRTWPALPIASLETVLAAEA